MQQIQRQIVLRAKDARKRLHTTEAPKSTSHAVAKKVKSKKIVPQEKPAILQDRGKAPVLEGRLIMGHKAVLLDDKQNCVSYFEDNIPPLNQINRQGRYVFLSGQHRLVSWEQKNKPPFVAGTRGHCKAYIQTSETEGVIIFHEQRMVGKTNAVLQELVKRDLAPPGRMISLKFVFEILDCKKTWKKKRLKATSCIVVRHINFPTFLYDLQNDDHCKVLYGEKRFHTVDELVNSKYWSVTIDNLKEKYEFIYKKNKFKSHPKFTSEEFERFCDRIINLLAEEPVFSRARPSKMKWGNVLYCMDAKKWYWVDF